MGNESWDTMSSNYGGTTDSLLSSDPYFSLFNTKPTTNGIKKGDPLKFSDPLSFGGSDKSDPLKFSDPLSFGGREKSDPLSFVGSNKSDPLKFNDPLSFGGSNRSDPLAFGKSNKSDPLSFGGGITLSSLRNGEIKEEPPTEEETGDDTTSLSETEGEEPPVEYLEKVQVIRRESYRI